ncbi:MAG: TauD/TfdA family dioxygenase, partial [Alphaproteobacteria bacterium]|nr:TauD/TfdA family dioxygenase [Alphaproteobacteria bacterium]
MPLEIAPLHDEFGIRIKGVDLSQPLEQATRDEIMALADRYSFLCFPGQSMDDERQLALTRSLGEPEPSHTAVGHTEYFGTIGNVQPDGTALGNDHRKTVFLTGNNMWHSDASFKPVPAWFSIMCAYETPAQGGETMFVSTRSAYARLDAERQRQLDPLVAIHDYVFSRSKVAPDAVSPELAASLPPVRQRLVRRNPRTGARNLFLGSHVREIEGWSEAEGRALIDELTAEATADEHVYSHAWRPGEVVIWDNRCLLHRGAGYDADRFRRYMRQTRTRGTGPTIEEAASLNRSRESERRSRGSRAR